MLNVGLFWLGFRLLTAREVSWRHHRGGAIAVAVLYTVRKSSGSRPAADADPRATGVSARRIEQMLVEALAWSGGDGKFHRQYRW